MPLHPNLRKGSMSPKEKANDLAKESEGYSRPGGKHEPAYTAH